MWKCSKCTWNNLIEESNALYQILLYISILVTEFFMHYFNLDFKIIM
jgi:hypothetical protein